MSKEAVKPTREQFEGYLRVQKSGVTNMWAVDTVCELAKDYGLTEENCLYIFTGSNYADLCDEYNIGVKDIFFN